MLCAAGGPGGPCSFGMPAAKQRFAINELIRTNLLYRSVQYRVRVKINAKLGWFTKQHAGPNPVSKSIRLLLRIMTSLLPIIDLLNLQMMTTQNQYLPFTYGNKLVCVGFEGSVAPMGLSPQKL